MDYLPAYAQTLRVPIPYLLHLPSFLPSFPLFQIDLGTCNIIANIPREIPILFMCIHNRTEGIISPEKTAITT
jgi:hypothetical protein